MVHLKVAIASLQLFVQWWIVISDLPATMIFIRFCLMSSCWLWLLF